MKTKYIIFAVLFLPPTFNIYAEGSNIPAIQFSNGEFNLQLPKAMQDSLNKYDPNFKPWGTSDYAKKIIDDSDPNSTTAAPFSLIIDVNQDNILDVIIDGHNDTKPEIICILSTEKSFNTIHVGSWHNELNPRDIKNYSETDGTVDVGLNYYLWPNEERSEYPDLIFSIGIAQQFDVNGNLLHDGGIIEYLYKDDKFVQNIQTL